MSALMSTFKGSASGENLVDAGALDAEGSGLDSANDSLFKSSLNAKPDLMQTMAAQIAPAEPQSQPQQATKQQVEAQKQLNDLLSRQQNLGAAKSAGDAGGSNRMKSAQDAAQQFTTKAAQLQSTAAGIEPKAGLTGSFAKAAVGAVLGAGATMAAGVASPAAAQAVGAATQAKTAYDVVAAFEGRAQGPSSFRSTDSKGRDTGYVSAAPVATEQAPASAAFMRKLTQVPGDLDAGRIGLTSQGLNDVESAPVLNAKKLQDSVAWKGLAGVNRNGLEVARAGGEAPKPEDESLNMAPKAPLPGVFAPPKPLPLMG